MRFVAYLLLFYSLSDFGKGIHDLNRGVTMDRRGVAEVPVSKRTEEELFRGLISYRFSRAAIFLIGASLLLGIAKRLDANDPNSPDLTANTKDEPIDPMLEEELRKRRCGLR